MITLNTDRGLITVQSWDDVANLAGYTPNLDHEEHVLASIIGRYVFPDKVKCGLAGCHTPHNRGYVVTTQSGPVTNIGKDCGKKHFGVCFEELSRGFEHLVQEKEMRERLATFAIGIDELEDTLHELLNGERAAGWVNKRVRALQARGGDVPDTVIRHLADMARSGSGTLSREREARTEEIDALRATGARTNNPHYVQEPIGDIAGTQALYPEHDLRRVLIVEIDEPLKVFKALNIDTMSFQQLKHWTKWHAGVESNLETARGAVSYGQALLSLPNLEQFNQVLTHEEIKQFRAFLNTLKAPH